ncbi:MAG: DUF4091 domain-containing protein [Clostridiales bacterium]|nr:DUF4091 domain-containing protein [Clostridiales bacterium]
MSDIKLTLLSPLVKVMRTESPTGNFSSFSMLKNEKKSFQLYISAKCEKVAVDVKSELGCIKAYTVEYIPGGFAINKKTDDDYVIKSADDFYPDLLSDAGRDVKMQSGQRTMWFEIAPAEPLAAGKYSIEITVSNESGAEKCALSVEVIDAELPPQKLIYTNWLHTDCLSDEYKVAPFSDDWWKIVKNYLKTAAQHGMNCVLTPLFTPPLDTVVGGERQTVQLVGVKYENGRYSFNFDRLVKWVETARSCSIEYFELSHFFTQWGAKHAPKIIANVSGEEKQIFGWKTSVFSKKYKQFLADLAAELKPFLENAGLKDKVLVHVSDEPNFSVYLTYKHASKLVSSLFSGYKIVDALSDVRLYSRGLVKTPIAANDHIEPFLGKVSEVWTYYCSAQGGKYVSNRFFSTPSERNRVLGFQLYKFNAVGFLHWGYNFWYSQYSKKKINPFETADAAGAFQAGDSFVVYPKKDGTPYVSLRLKVFYDGLQDMLALEALEALTSREYALSVLEEGLDEKLTFSVYPHSPAWLLETRERINRAIKENI